MERKATGQYVAFSFCRVDREWRRLPPEARERGIREVLAMVQTHGEKLRLRSFSCQGFRRDVDFLLWLVARELPLIRDFAIDLARTGMGPYIDITHHYLAMTRESAYLKGAPHTNPGSQVGPGGAEWLFVYPFVKSREWYSLPFEARKRMMDEHLRVGHEFPNVKINTTYSFGLDDQEFVLAFETDSPSDFRFIAAVTVATTVSKSLPTVC